MFVGFCLTFSSHNHEINKKIYYILFLQGFKEKVESMQTLDAVTFSL